MTKTQIKIKDSASKEEIQKAYEKVGAHAFPSRCKEHNEFTTNDSKDKD